MRKRTLIFNNVRQRIDLITHDTRLFQTDLNNSIRFKTLTLEEYSHINIFVNQFKTKQVPCQQKNVLYRKDKICSPLTTILTHPLLTGAFNQLGSFAKEFE